MNADAALASALHQALTLKVQALYVRMPGEAERQTLEGHFKPKGFADDDRLWPKGDSAFSGYQLLLEYFTFREKFMFVTLCGLESLSLPLGATWFELDVVLCEAWSHAPYRDQWPTAAQGPAQYIARRGLAIHPGGAAGAQPDLTHAAMLSAES